MSHNPSPHTVSPAALPARGRIEANPWCTKAFALSLVDLIDLVGSTTKVSRRQLLHPERSRNAIARPWQLAMYLLHVSAGWKMEEVARFFGRHRTTVSHACARVEDRRDCPEFDALVDSLEAAADALADGDGGSGAAGREAPHGWH